MNHHFSSLYNIFKTPISMKIVLGESILKEIRSLIDYFLFSVLLANTTFFVSRYTKGMVNNFLFSCFSQMQHFLLVGTLKEW
jgi:hypothetical protein